MPPIRVAVDDHPVVLTDLRPGPDANVEVVGEAANGREALQFLKACSRGRCGADGCVDGRVRWTRHTGYITKDYPHIRVLMLDAH
jgi:hypothetical protein